jgi:hypothetical protein
VFESPRSHFSSRRLHRALVEIVERLPRAGQLLDPDRPAIAGRAIACGHGQRSSRVDCERDLDLRDAARRGEMSTSWNFPRLRLSRAAG